LVAARVSGDSHISELLYHLHTLRSM